MDFVSDPSNKPSGVEKPVRIEAGFQILHDGKALSGFSPYIYSFSQGQREPSKYGLIMYNPRFLVKGNPIQSPFPLPR